jgi:hypothetical protein
MADFVAAGKAVSRSSVQILKDFANDPSVPTSLRISAAAAAAPYEQSKLLPVAGPVYLYSKINIDDFKSIEEAESFLLTLSQREAAGELESMSVQTVSERVRLWIQLKRQGQELDIKRLAQGQETGDQIIRIEGGLPALPGTNVTMPSLNGHDKNGLLPPQPRQIESSPAPESATAASPVATPPIADSRMDQQGPSAATDGGLGSATAPQYSDAPNLSPSPLRHNTVPSPEAGDQGPGPHKSLNNSGERI